MHELGLAALACSISLLLNAAHRTAVHMAHPSNLLTRKACLIKAQPEAAGSAVSTTRQLPTPVLGHDNDVCSGGGQHCEHAVCVDTHSSPLSSLRTARMTWPPA